MAGSKNKDNERPGHRSGNRRPEPRTTQISKRLSYLLRHGAENANVKLYRGGWVRVSDVLAWGDVRRLKASFEEIIEVTATNEKKRYQIAPAALVLKDGEEAESTEQPAVTELVTLDEGGPDDPGMHLIRATQGHSIKSVDAEDLLTPLTAEDFAAGKVPEVAVHGTNEKAWGLIEKAGGLRPMTRQHVHLAGEVPGGPNPVISGMRKSANVHVWVNVKRSLEDGVKWWVSANNVILSEGSEGVVSIKYFDRVERRDAKGETTVIWTPGSTT